MRFALAILLLCGSVYGQRLTDEESAAVIERARAAALDYTASLPDFICTQIVHRSQDPRGDNRWQPLDVLTVRLSYSDGKENYRLVEINGKPTVLDYMNTGGPTSKGEFGSLLLLLFDPDAAAEFRWKGWTMVHKQRAAVFNFKVDQAHTQYHVLFGDVPGGKARDIVAPYFGEVEVIPESGRTLRIKLHAALPLGFPIRESSTMVEYENTEVGPRSYLLPARAEVAIVAGRYTSKNVVEFKDYRKFQTETVITFDK